LKQSRLLQLTEWLNRHFNVENIALTSLSGDAGFRKYYRFEQEGVSYIAVDAPPKMSNNLAFVEIQKTLQQAEIQVPDIIMCDLNEGFLCLSDFGDVLFSDGLTLATMTDAYKNAIALLPRIANASVPKGYSLPIYDAEFIRTELTIFIEWLLQKHLTLSLSKQEKISLQCCFDVLVESALEQPQVIVHRDYHSRNLMWLGDTLKAPKTLGVIDFQDAVVGPATYDVVSLLRDCYVKWPNENVETLFTYYCQLSEVEKKYPDITPAQWIRWFDLMGLQRHIKASGIFARLYHRDDKGGYLKDIPLTLSYIVDISAKYPELNALHDLVLHKVIPALHGSTKDQGLPS